MSKNIILVTADSFRADHCGFLSGMEGVTPTLDRLAQESTVYENAISPGPRTPSSIPVLFTGEFLQNYNKAVYSSRTAKKYSWRERRERIKRHLSRFRPISKRLQAEGYSTGAVTSNPWTDTDTGFDRGFDEFRPISGDTISEAGGWTLRRLLKKAEGISVLPDIREWTLTWKDFYEEILTVRDQLSEPYFLWVFLLDPHQPYFAPREYREENNALEMYYSNLKYNYSHNAFEQLPTRLENRFKRAYRDTCRSVDGFVSTILSELAADDPALVFHSDHGEAFLEHGTYGHRHELYEENLHVPLLLHNVDENMRISEPISLQQLPNIITAIADDDLKRTLRYTREYIISKTEENERVAVRTENWKYITSRDDWDFVRQSPSTELYRLQTDPQEQKNCLEECRCVVELLENILLGHESGLAERAEVATACKEIVKGANCEL